MTVHREAHVQYDDMTGTSALDTADFERWEEVLGLEGWLPLGLHFFFHHPSLHGNAASSSNTSFRVWAIEWSELSTDRNLPTLLSEQTPISVTEFAFEGEDVSYSEPSNAAAVLLRGSKRLTVNLWSRAVQDAGLGEDDFDVVDEKYMVWRDGAWVEYHGE